MIRPEPLRLEPLRVEHLDAVAALEARVSPAPWTRSLFAGELTLPADVRLWLVALEGEQLLGFLGMMTVGDEAHLMNIAVDPDHRRQGLARRLVVAGLDGAMQLGCRHLTLEVRPDNEPALALYRRLGMTVEGRRPDYYGPGRDALILWVRDIDRPDYLASIGADSAPDSIPSTAAPLDETTPGALTCLDPLT